jgi:hypothetical protein
MGRKLYVGNLPYEVGENELQELFWADRLIRSVSADQATGRARGFAFVEMSTDDEAQRSDHRTGMPARWAVAISPSTARPKVARVAAGRVRQWRRRFASSPGTALVTELNGAGVGKTTPRFVYLALNARILGACQRRFESVYASVSMWW